MFKNKLSIVCIGKNGEEIEHTILCNDFRYINYRTSNEIVILGKNSETDNGYSLTGVMTFTNVTIS